MWQSDSLLSAARQAMTAEETLAQVREIAVEAHRRGLGFAYDVLRVLEAHDPAYSRPMDVHELEEPDG